MYVEGVIAAVPNENKEKYLKHAQLAAEVFKENGALQVVECWQEDVNEGQLTSFPKAVLLKENESVVFSWITWPSKQARVEGMEKSMSDPRMENNEMPFDGMRLIYGGFDMIFNSEVK